MKRLVVMLPLMLGLASCMYSTPELPRICKEFLEGVNPADVSKCDVAFRGNHGGYAVVMRIRGTESVIRSLLAKGKRVECWFGEQLWLDGLKSEFDMQFEYLGGVPVWWDFPFDRKFEVVRISGSNGYTSSYTHTFYWDTQTKILYVLGSGI